MVRQYAQVVGIVVIVIGVAGLLLGDQLLLGVLNIDIVEDIVHLVTGGLLAYAGFAMRDSRAVRNVVGGLGVLYLLVLALGVVSPTLFGLLPHGYTIVDHLIHLVLGALSIAVGWYVGRDRTATT